MTCNDNLWLMVTKTVSFVLLIVLKNHYVGQSNWANIISGEKSFSLPVGYYRQLTDTGKVKVQQQL